jgi:CheY-like chemotaxis protein
MSRPCILIAEDDADIRETLADVLRDAGYQVAVAENGQVALDAMRDQQPCMLVLDLMMPEVDGWQVIGAMERDPGLASVPVCVLSAVTERAPPSAVCVLKKPVSLLRLLSAIEQYCGEHASCR